jgi:3-methylfumaryl-CoA hydratase
MTVTAELVSHLQTWVGKQETTPDQITAAPVRALAATLDRQDAPPVIGQTVLPELWHWLYFLPTHRQSELGPDGHAKRGGFLPPIPLPRRMWAGGRLQWKKPLVVGDTITRISTIRSVDHKVGRSGELMFVCVEHQVHTPQGLALVEEHDIVYRDNPTQTSGTQEAAAAPALAPTNATWSKTLHPDDVMLFRYSALTFNGHRIHYDRRYVTEIEHYPGLIVHGPLIATLLVNLVRDCIPGATLSRFQFKAVRPTFDTGPMTVNGRIDLDSDPSGKTIALWAADAQGFLTMQATAVMV